MARSLDDYQPVDERIHQFWGDYEHGAIIPELVYAQDGVYRFRVEIFTHKDDLHPIAVGYAEETVGKGGPVNRQGFTLENCETSAVGRALANAGYSPRGLRPSREEMSRVPSGSPVSNPGSSTSQKDTSGSASSSPALTVVRDSDPDATRLQLQNLFAKTDTLDAWNYTAIQKHTKNLFLLMEQLGIWPHNALEASLKKHGLSKRGLRSRHDELVPFARLAFDTARTAYEQQIGADQEDPDDDTPTPEDLEMEFQTTGDDVYSDDGQEP